jgi:hypothetical protein
MRFGSTVLRRLRAATLPAVVVVLGAAQASAADRALTAGLRAACEASFRGAAVAETIRPAEDSPLAPYARFCHALTRETVLQFRGGTDGYVCTLLFQAAEDGFVPIPPHDTHDDETERADTASEEPEATREPPTYSAEEAMANRAAFDAVFGQRIRGRIEAQVGDELIRAFSGSQGQSVDVYLMLGADGRVGVEARRTRLLGRVERVATPSEVMRVVGLTAGMAFGGCGSLKLDRVDGAFVVSGLNHHRGGCAPIAKLTLRVGTDAKVTELERTEGTDGICLE